MVKLILSLENALLSEHPLDKDRMTIGRRPTNDIQIDNLAISGEHAVIVQMGNDYFIEDLDSTNGTLVNNKAIKKHLLQHGDLVEFGKYQLKYVSEAVLNHLGMGSEADFEKTMIIHPSMIENMAAPVAMSANPAALKRPSSVEVPKSATASTNTSESVGKIQVLNGSSSGRELVLNKALTTLGKPGVQVAVITKRPNGYFITHVEGQVHPMVNGSSTGAQAFALSDHDIIELAGVKMEFYLVKT